MNLRKNIVRQDFRECIFILVNSSNEQWFSWSCAFALAFPVVSLVCVSPLKPYPHCEHQFLHLVFTPETWPSCFGFFNSLQSTIKLMTTALFAVLAVYACVSTQSGPGSDAFVKIFIFNLHWELNSWSFIYTCRVWNQNRVTMTALTHSTYANLSSENLKCTNCGPDHSKGKTQTTNALVTRARMS